MAQFPDRFFHDEQAKCVYEVAAPAVSETKTVYSELRSSSATDGASATPLKEQYHQADTPDFALRNFSGEHGGNKYGTPITLERFTELYDQYVDEFRDGGPHGKH